MKQYFFYVAMVLTVAACNGGDKHEGHEGHEDHAAARKDGFSEKPVTLEDSLYKQVIAGHDEAMAKMGKIRGFQSTVKDQLDSLKKLPSGKLKEGLLADYKLLAAQLDTAYVGMNNWMEHFNPDSAKEDATKRIEYLQSELSKVSKVKEAIVSGLATADSVLKK